MLDPQRIGLNAASVGYLKRRRENVDWESFNKQLQTDDGGCVNVRRTVQTPVNEIHVMGGELKGLESNSNLLDRSRQFRQMNAYPLRSFSADAPAIILPPKYGGLPMYTRQQTEYADYVSRFTEPMSAILQRDTELLGTMGFSASNESASNPYRHLGFEMNMHKPQVAINMNEAIIRQRRFLEASSKIGQSQKHNLLSAGVFVSANGDPITEVEDAVDSDRATINAFHLHRAKQDDLMQRTGRYGNASARVDPRGGVAMVRGNRGSLGRVVHPVAVNLAIAGPPIPAAVKTAMYGLSATTPTVAAAAAGVFGGAPAGTAFAAALHAPHVPATAGTAGGGGPAAGFTTPAAAAKSTGMTQAQWKRSIGKAANAKMTPALTAQWKAYKTTNLVGTYSP
jgi:hypothetical protein